MKRIQVKNIGKEFKIGKKGKRSALARVITAISGREEKEIFRAVNNVSFDVAEGEIVGLIGKNGSGKSTILRMIAKIIPLYEGTINTDGKILPLINLGEGMIDRLTLIENIALIGSLFGMSQKEIKRKQKSIIAFAELQDFENTKLFQFSLGMVNRLAFSVAIHAEPKILLLDEVFAVGDESFRKKSAGKIKECVKKGASVILVSHEMWMIEKYCSRVIWLEKGKIKMEGNTKKVLEKYKENEKK